MSSLRGCCFRAAESGPQYALTTSPKHLRGHRNTTEELWIYQASHATQFTKAMFERRLKSLLLVPHKNMQNTPGMPLMFQASLDVVVFRFYPQVQVSRFSDFYHDGYHPNH
ncbi:Proto-oncogene tyrosine-protein kinase ROS [Trichinella spiralis]|uniref:Proto-oncogene tyrosine-protein kinase ROS n=1 Tax=Trichinella spiralis TaxID=6334 RepID=A0ABR3KBV5_TRISP